MSYILTPFERAKAIADNFEAAESIDDCYLYTFTGTAALNKVFTHDGLLTDWSYDYDPSDPSQVCYFGIGNLRSRHRRLTNNSKRKIQPPNENRIILRHGLSIDDVFKLEVLLISRFGKLFDGGCLANESDGGPGCFGRILPETYFRDHQETLLANATWYLLLNTNKEVLDRGTANGLAKKYGIDPGAVAGIARGKSAGAWDPVERRQLIFCLEDEYATFQPRVSNRLREIILVSPIGEVDKGLGRELAKRHSINPSHIHRAADPKREGRTCGGYQVFYPEYAPPEVLSRLS